MLVTVVCAADLPVEWATPTLNRGHVDLLVGKPPSIAVSFKYPREPWKEPACTQALGEVARDFCRRNVRWSAPLGSDATSAVWPTATVSTFLSLILVPEQACAWPPTALRVLGRRASEVEVTPYACLS
jgi:hypothetical protein